MTIQPLQEKIIRLIKESGPITFERFMELSLYDPDFGYYTSGALPVGREGDFYTSPHLHPAFGRLIGRQIEEMWEKMGRPVDFSVIEMGAGRGYLAFDMLGYLKGRDIYDALVYRIVELNPTVQEHQAAILAEFRGRIVWARSLSGIRDVTGCLLSNELLDAFPVHIVVMENTLREIYVATDGDSLREEIGPLSTDALADYFKELKLSLPAGYRTEANLRIRRWLGEAAGSLREGFILTIDYGYTAREYYSEDHDRGTLMCYHRHQLAENPLKHIGEQDITAHVNFSAVKQWGDAMGLKAIGYTGQGAFLMSLGVDEEIQRLAASSDDYLFEAAKIKRLILPQGMGESHMALIQYKGEGAPILKGFSMRNRLRYL